MIKNEKKMVKKNNNKKHYENTPIQIYIDNSISKNLNFSDKKNSNIFHISAQNIDCWYSMRRF